MRKISSHGAAQICLIDTMCSACVITYPTKKCMICGCFFLNLGTEMVMRCMDLR